MNEITVPAVRSSRRTVLNLVCSIAEHLISGGVALFLTPFLIDRLGIELYGLYPIVLELAALFGIAFGVVNSTSGRYIAIEEERGNGENASKYFCATFFSNAAIGIVLLLPMGLLVGFSNRFLEIPAGAVGELKVFMILTFAAVAVDALAAAFGSVYYITNRLDLRAGQQLVSVAVKAALLALLLFVFEPSLVGVGIAILASSAVGSAVQIIASRKLTPSLTLSLSAFSLSSARRLMASGLWYSFNRVASVMMCGALLIMANSFFKPAVSGAYSVAFVFVNALSGVIMTLAAVFVPVSAKCFARGERNRLRDSLARDEKVVGYFAAVAVSVALAFCGDFFRLWLGEDANRLLITLSAVLLVPTLSLACATPIINVGMVMNRTRKLSLLFLCGGLLTLAAALAVIFFTNMGIMGLAAVSCAAQIVWYSAAVPCFACKVLSCSPKIFFLPILRTYLAAGVSLGVCLALQAVCRINTWLEFIIVGGAAAVVAAVVAFFCVFKSFDSFKIRL